MTINLGTKSGGCCACCKCLFALIFIVGVAVGLFFAITWFTNTDNKTKFVGWFKTIENNFDEHILNRNITNGIAEIKSKFVGWFKGALKTIESKVDDVLETISNETENVIS